MNLKKILPRSVREKLMNCLWFLPDRLYIQLFYFATTGRYCNLKHPVLFSEKQQWLKLHEQNPDYSRLVDKLAVRSHIDEVLGSGHCFPLLGVWDKFEDIDFNTLPDAFVLKCNHDSASTVVISDKKKLSPRRIKQLQNHFNNRLKHDFFYAGREYPYKGIKPKIIAEQLMRDDKNPKSDIEDYKFFCFNGKPKIMFVVTDRTSDCRFDFFDMNFNGLDIVNIHPHADKKIEKPKHFEELKKAASKLSEGMKFVRIDLYEINDKIYFGEYSFFHGGGFCLFYPLVWEKRLGDWIKLGE